MGCNNGKSAATAGPETVTPVDKTVSTPEAVKPAEQTANTPGTVTPETEEPSLAGGGETGAELSEKQEPVAGADPQSSPGSGGETAPPVTADDVKVELEGEPNVKQLTENDAPVDQTDASDVIDAGGQSSDVAGGALSLEMPVDDKDPKDQGSEQPVCKSASTLQAPAVNKDGQDTAKWSCVPAPCRPCSCSFKEQEAATEAVE